MKKNFNTFLDNITLTATQRADAQTKYTNVCKKLYSHFYSGNYNEDKKFLFGSYKTGTNVRPMTAMQDVDVLFKIPEEVFDRYDSYASNGQEALLQEVRTVLKERFPTTDKIKAWGKVVLVQFADNHHNVEILPALEKQDGTFLIPNSEDGGSWDSFDPRAEIEKFNKSNQNSNGLTKDMAKMLKAWAHYHPSMEYKSCSRLNDIMMFIRTYTLSYSQETQYDKILFDFFDYMRSRCSSSIKSYIDTAFSHALKAIEYRDKGQLKKAAQEWSKVFGQVFPTDSIVDSESEKPDKITNPASPWSN